LSFTISFESLGSTEIEIADPEWGGTFAIELTRPIVEVEIIGGAPGPAGIDGVGANPYVHEQPAAAAEWIVNHNLGRKPSGVEVLTPGGVAVIADIRHITENQLRIYLAVPSTGSVLAL
jgi:hypothetical protein